MRFRRLNINSLFLAFCVLLFSCTTPSKTPAQTFLYVYRFAPPAFVEFSADLQKLREIPFAVPADCGILDNYPAPVGEYLLIELSCPNGQTVLFLDTDSGTVTQPVRDTDSHFLAWMSDGNSAYLKIDSLGNARVVRMFTTGKYTEIHITGWTYDLSGKPNTDDFIFAFSSGLGSGSELNFSEAQGLNADVLYADSFNYISFARYSPDGSQIAFLKIPDSPIPFTVGELWVMNADGSEPRKLAEADAGHGYALNWSPDGKRIAFVQRENAQDESANQSAESLISNVYMIDVQSGKLTPVTYLTQGRAETPRWSPGGNTLIFNVVLNGRIEVQIAELDSGLIQPVSTEPACCAAWIRK